MYSLKNLALVAAVFAAVFTGGQASAGEAYRKVVHDVRGNVVKNTFNNCVYTNWQSAGNECVGMGLSLEDRTIYFDFNKSNLTPDAIVKLDRLANVIRDSKDVMKANIYGYADKIGNEAYNKRLSMRRAQAVRNYLAKKGLKTGVVDLRALGENNPRVDCADKSKKELIKCLAPNRRVEVEMEYVK